MYFFFNYVIFTLKKIPSVKQCRISTSADRWEHLVMPLVIIGDFLTAKQVYKICDHALQTFISVFPVPNTNFQDPCFSHKDLSGLFGLMGFLSLSRGGRASLCFVFYLSQKLELFSTVCPYLDDCFLDWICKKVLTELNWNWIWRD